MRRHARRVLAARARDHNCTYDARKCFDRCGRKPERRRAVRRRELAQSRAARRTASLSDGTATELELLAGMLMHGANVLDRPPQPLPDRDIGFVACRRSPSTPALIRAARSADIEAMRLPSTPGRPGAARARRFQHCGRRDRGPEIRFLTVATRAARRAPTRSSRCSFLLERGANIDAATAGRHRDAHGAKRGYTGVLRFLQCVASNLNPTDKACRTPLTTRSRSSRILRHNRPRARRRRNLARAWRGGGRGRQASLARQ